MNLIILCFVLGLVLLGFEVFLPGAIIGIFGTISLIVGVVLVGANYGATPAVISAAGVVAAIAATLVAELVWLPKSRFAARFTVRSTSGAEKAPLAPGDIVGQTGEAATVLAPSGYVTVGGHRYEAFSQSGHLVIGQQVKITGQDNFRLLVTKI